MLYKFSFFFLIKYAREPGENEKKKIFFLLHFFIFLTSLKKLLDVLLQHAPNNVHNGTSTKYRAIHFRCAPKSVLLVLMEHLVVGAKWPLAII